MVEVETFMEKGKPGRRDTVPSRAKHKRAIKKKKLRRGNDEFEKRYKTLPRNTKTKSHGHFRALWKNRCPNINIFFPFV